MKKETYEKQGDKVKKVTKEYDSGNVDIDQEIAILQAEIDEKQDQIKTLNSLR